MGDYYDESRKYYDKEDSLYHKVALLKKEQGNVNFDKLYAIKMIERFKAHDMRPMQYHEFTFVLTPHVKIEYYIEIPKDYVRENEPSEDIKLVEIDDKDHSIGSVLKQINFSLWNENAPKSSGWCSNPTHMSFEFIDEDGIWCNAWWTDDGESHIYDHFDDFQKIIRSIRSKAYSMESII